MKNKAAPSKQAKPGEIEVSLELATGLLHSMQEGLVVLDPKGIILDANPAFCQMTGYSREELVGRGPPFPYWPPEEYESIQAALNNALDGIVTNFETFYMHQNGERFPVAVRPFVVKNKAGKIISYSATVKDITARKTTQEALQTSEELFRRIVQSAQEGIWRINGDSLTDYVNPKMALMMGYEPEEMFGRPIDDFLDDESRDLLAYHIERRKRGIADQFEFKYMRKNGSALWAFVSTNPITNASGDYVGAVALLTDTTERKRAEAALWEADQKLRLHFEQSPMAVIEWDLDFRVTRWNPAAGAIFGYSRDEALGRHASFIVPESFRPQVDEKFQALLKQSGGQRSTNENLCRDGKTILCEWYNTPLIDERGTVTGVACLAMDVTERQLLQKLLTWKRDILEMISSTASLHEVLSRLTIGLEKQLPDALCSALLLDDDGIHLRLGAAPSLPEAYNRAIDGMAIGPTAGSCGTAAYTGRQVIVADIGSDPLWGDYRELALGHDLRACWSTPIHGKEGKILGTYAIYFREPRQPTPSQLEVISRVVNLTRIAIQWKQSEASLRESEERFHTLFENASDAIFITQGELFIECNARTLEMFGCQSRDQILGHTPYEFSPRLQPDGRNSTESAIEKINATLNGQPQFFEWMHTKLDGTPFPAEVNLIKVEVGGKMLHQAIIRDISERKQAEEMIRQQNAELESRVKKRTSALSKANKALRGHMVTRRRLEKQILEISEREQKRIGQDLHDDLGQQLAGIWCLSQLLESSLVAQKSPEAAAAAKITGQLKESLELTRKLAQGLYPVALQADGLSFALDELAKRTTEIYKISCRCKCRQKHVMDHTVATHLYRIAQEAITNATKHGHAQKIEIELSSNSRHTYLTVINDGMPMAEKTADGDGMGLRIMKYRADMIGGKLSVESNKHNAGTSVTCMIQKAGN